MQVRVPHNGTQRLLESSSDPIELVAKRAGYDSDATMRAQFSTRLQTSPRAYRRRFQPTIKNDGSIASPR